MIPRQTVSGTYFRVFDPKVEDVFLFDIAHALSNICRFGSHCLKFYSVAEHCTRMVENEWNVNQPLDDDNRRQLLLSMFLHDASETYLIDLPHPIKHAFREMYIGPEEQIHIVYASRIRSSISNT